MHNQLDAMRGGKSDAASRVVPIIGRLLPELRDRPMRSGRRGGDLVFGRTPTQPFEPSTVRRRALAAWEDASLAPIGLHESRHTFASLLIAAGVDLKQVSTYMGHSSILITVMRYAHLFPDARERAVRAVDAFLAGEPPGQRREV